MYADNFENASLLDGEQPKRYNKWAVASVAFLSGIVGTNAYSYMMQPVSK